MDSVLFCGACGAFRPLVFRGSSRTGADAGDDTTVGEGLAIGADIDGDAVTCSQCGFTSKFMSKFEYCNLFIAKTADLANERLSVTDFIPYFQTFHNYQPR